MAKLYSVYGFTREVEPQNGSDFTLNELQGLVDGDIELIHLSANLLMVVNENGIADELPINVRATRLCESYGLRNTLILGRALVCKDNEIK